jgi:hypothetical protein
MTKHITSAELRTLYDVADIVGDSETANEAYERVIAYRDRRFAAKKTARLAQNRAAWQKWNKAKKALDTPAEPR